MEALKSKVQEMEEEAEKLRQMQEGIEGELAEGEDTAEADQRSVYVGQVDYSATPEELQEHFAGCGTVNRVTILCDRFRNPKGFAYIEFADAEAVGDTATRRRASWQPRGGSSGDMVRPTRGCNTGDRWILHPCADNRGPSGPSSRRRYSDKQSRTRWLREDQPQRLAGQLRRRLEARPQPTREHDDADVV